MVNACGHCAACNDGFEQHCHSGATYTYGWPDASEEGGITQGGYSEKIVVNQNFVLRVPDTLDMAAAAPLLCAGITTWAPLQEAGIGRAARWPWWAWAAWAIWPSNWPTHWGQRSP
jgi:uncharacterized zinc-type alcohol dehydrogenase-like protein